MPRESKPEEVRALWRALRIATASATNAEAADHLLLARRHLHAHLCRAAFLTDQAGGDWVLSWAMPDPQAEGRALQFTIRVEAADIAEPTRLVDRANRAMSDLAAAIFMNEPLEALN